MKSQKYRATIVSIDHLNKSFEVKIADYQTELEANGNVLLPFPKEQISDYFEVGDEIEFKMKQKSCEMFNLSCQFLRFSKFKRDLTSVLRRLDNYNHPLKRCILLNEPDFVLLSSKKNLEKSMLLLKPHKS
jgi:hypothetical protein